MDRDSIGLRLSNKYDKTAKEFVTTWEFLALDGQPLGGKGSSPQNLRKFLSYIRLLYLSALRNSSDEFSPRSQFWGKILRDLKIDEKQAATINAELTTLNADLLKADPRLEQVRESLDKIQKIMVQGASDKTTIQALPLKPFTIFYTGNSFYRYSNVSL